MTRTLKSSQLLVLSLMLGMLFGAGGIFGSAAFLCSAECCTEPLDAAPAIQAVPLDYDQTQYRCIEGRWQTVDGDFEKPFV